MATYANAYPRITASPGNDFVFSQADQSTVFGGAGNDVIVGDYGPVFLPGQIVDVDDAAFNTTTRNPLVGGPQYPHTTIVVEPVVNQTEFTLFIKAEPGEIIRIDIDYAYSPRGGHDVNTSLYVKGTNLYDDNASFGLDLGSDTIFDPDIFFEARGGETLEIVIKSFDSVPFTGDEAFLVHVSQSKQAALGYAAEGDDDLNGGSGSDHIFGVAGNDTLRGGTGNDRLDGGIGVDWAAFDDTRGGGVNVNLTQGFSAPRRGGSSGTDHLLFIESVLGSNLNDSIVGDRKANSLIGNRGSDIIRGLAGYDSLSGSGGSDTIVGGNGQDTIAGGAGADRIVYVSGNDRDVVLGFEDGTDKLDLRGMHLTGAEVLDAAGRDFHATVIDFAGSDAIVLRGFRLADFSRDDFIL